MTSNNDYNYFPVIHIPEEIHEKYGHIFILGFSLAIESLLNKSQRHLPPEFAHKMLLLELALENDAVEQPVVQELLQHYRVLFLS